MGGDWFYLIVILNISITDAAMAGSSSSGLAKQPTERDLSILQEETKERGCFTSDTEKEKDDAHLLCLPEQVTVQAMSMHLAKKRKSTSPVCTLVDPSWHNKTAE